MHAIGQLIVTFETIHISKDYRSAVCNMWWALNGLLVDKTNFRFVCILVMSLRKLGTIVCRSL